MNRAPLATVTFGEPARAPAVRPEPAPAALQYERLRLAAQKRARKAEKLRKELPRG